MSTTVDQRVVEMRFDNKNFESNVKTTMSTLDRLKQSLNLTGASKGLNEINNAAKNNNLSALGNAAETVGLRFNAMYTMADQALRNITNRVQHTAERMISALTLDPIKTGFQEYETQINAVQTILANTSHNGTTIDDVNKSLEELNKYADMTIYNFTEMTRNIGTFTAAGLDLDTSTKAIQGIANLAAVSGSTSQQASTAMYQLSQALAAGSVKLMDWNSVVNASMGGKVFQDAIMNTVKGMEDVDQAVVRAYESGENFRSLLNPKDYGDWFTSDVLSKTLEKFTETGAVEYLGELYNISEDSILKLQEIGKTTGFTSNEFKNMALSIAGGNESVSKNISDILTMANTATDAATKVKTFTQLWDVLKESAQSGWSQTWKLIVGDFEEAKSLLTPLSDFLTGAINSFSEARNKLLDSAFSKNFSHMFDGISSVINKTFNRLDGVLEPINKVTASIDDLGTVVDDVILGKFGNGADRFKALTDAGLNYYRVQNKVNESLGNSFRHSEEKIAQQDKLLGLQVKSVENTKESADSIEEETKATLELNQAEKGRLVRLTNMTEAQLKANGYTEEQINTIKELKNQADKLGMTTYQFIDQLDEINGRWLLIQAFKNVGSGLVSVFKAMGDAWKGIFDATDEEKANRLFDILAGIHKFSTKFVMTKDTADKLTRTFKGLFAIVDVLTTVLGGGLRIALKTISSVLEYFDMDILSVTASIGDSLVAFRDWFDGLFDITAVLDVIVPVIENLTGKFKTWFNVMQQSTEFGRFTQALSVLAEHIRSFITGFVNIESIQDIPKYIVEGLINGLGDKAREVWTAFVEFARLAIQSFCETMGIESPSTVFFEFGRNIVQGLVNGIAAAIELVITSAKNLGSYVINIFKSIDFSGIMDKIGPTLDKFKELLASFDYKKLLAIIPVGVVLLMVKKIYDITSALADGINGFNDVLEGFAKVEEQFAKTLKAFSLNVKAKAFKQIAIAIAILVGAVILLTFIDTDKLYDAVGVIVVLAGVLAVLAWAVGKMNKASVSIDKEGLNISGVVTSLASIGIAMLLLGATVKMIGNMSPEQAEQGFKGLIGILTALLGVIVVMGTLAKNDMITDIDKVGGLLIKIAIAMALMVGVCKLVAKLTPDEAGKGLAFVALFTMFVAFLVKATTITTEQQIAKLGGLLLSISIAMVLMIGVFKLVAKLTPDEAGKGIAFVALYMMFVAFLVKASTIGNDKQIAKLGGLLLSISISLMLMVGVCKLAGKLEPAEMIKGALFLAGFLAFIKLLTMVTTISNDKQTAKLAGTILAMSIAIGMLAAVAILLSMVPIEGLVNGVLAVTIFGVMLSILILATHGAEKVVGNLIVITIAIGMLAGIVAALSLLPDHKKLWSATAAISVILGMFALLVKSAGMCTGSIGTLLVMTLAVGLIGALIYQLAHLPIESSMGAAAAISMLLLAMSASMVLIGTFGAISKTGLLALGAMTLVVVALARILWLIQDLPIESTMNNVKAISTLLIALSATCILLEIAGLGGSAALWGVSSLMALIAGVGGLIAVIGALVKEFPQLKEFLNVGVPIIETIGDAIGSFFGNIVGGFAEAATSNLPAVGENLSLFMDNLSGFISGAKTINDEALTGIRNLAEMMILISGASVVDKIASIFGDKSSMTTFSDSLGAFADAIILFSDKVKGNIDESSVLAAANAGKLLAEMQSKIPGSGGVVQWFCGEKNFETFGAGLVAFGNAIVEFSKVVGVEGAINETAIQAAINAGKMMAEMQSTLPGTGGVVQWFCGEKDFAAFGAGLVAFGEAITEFSSIVSAEGAINTTAIEAAASMGKIMTELQSSLEPVDGVWQWLAGEKNFETFGTQLKAFGQAMVDFSKTVSAEGAINETAITTVANAGKLMTEVQAAIPADKWLDGKISIDDFGKKIIAFGQSIVAYSMAVSEIDTTAVGTSITHADRLANLTRSIVDLDTAGINQFKDTKILGATLKNYYEKVSDIDSGAITSSVNDIKKIINVINGLVGLDASGVQTFKSAVANMAQITFNGLEKSFSGADAKLSTIGSDMMNSLVKGINAKQTSLNAAAITMSTVLYKAWMSRQDMFINTGSTLMNSFINGIKSKNSELSAAAKSTVTSAINSLRSCYSSFYSAGSYLVSGFASGISENSYKAAAQASAMANAAASAAKKELDINSPSKVFRAIGYCVPEGFADGIERMTRLVAPAATYMTDVVLNDVKESVSHIADLINFDATSQPTIRPVLDLTNVEKGASTIGNLFDGSPSIAVSSSLRSINSMMGQNQNGTNNADVVSAINELKSEIGKIQGNTNIIEGITYGDDSNIANAVQSLVRAATIERRI